MSDTIVTRALAEAVAAEGSSAALAQRLRVPQNTFSRWMSGRAQTPIKAFRKVIDLLAEHEKARGGPVETAAEAVAAPEVLQFAMDEILARCANCDGTRFTPSDPAARLMYTSELKCLGCGARVIRGNLIAQVAQDAVLHSRTLHAARERRRLARTVAAARKRGPDDASGGG